MVAHVLTKSVTVHERCRIRPSIDDGDGAEQTLVATYLDIPYVPNICLATCLLFFKLPCSTIHFRNNIVAKLKLSLSRTLKYYLPLAGNLLLNPLDLDIIPEFRYVQGDSVSFTIAELNANRDDFDNWTGHLSRGSAQFNVFLPHLPESKIDSVTGFKHMPLLSIQVTHFPGIGICFGFVSDHAIGDARTMFMFFKSWSLVNQLGEEDGVYECLLENALLPHFDRSVILDPSRRRANIYWNQKKRMANASYRPKGPDNTFRQTFVLRKTDLNKLMNSALAKRPSLAHLSPFHLSHYTVATAYIWSCHVKSAARIGEVVYEEEPEYFLIPVDARRHMDPPVPTEYFGNCIHPVVVGSTHGEMKGDEGFCTAVELIGGIISNKIKNKDEFMKGADDELAKISPLFSKRLLQISGMNKQDIYGVDFGWGKLKRYELCSIDGENALSLSKSGEFEGGFEISVSLPKLKMTAFAAIFFEGLDI